MSLTVCYGEYTDAMHTYKVYYINDLGASTIMSFTKIRSGYAKLPIPHLISQWLNIISLTWPDPISHRGVIAFSISALCKQSGRI